MPDAAGTVERLAAEMARALRPIAGRLADDQVLDTFEELGVRFPDQFRTDPTIGAARSTIVTVTAELDGLVEELFDAITAGDTVAMGAAALALVAQVGRVVAAFVELTDAVRTVGPTLPGITPAQVTELTTDLPAKLTSLLLAAVLERSATAGAVLAVFGIVERTFHPGVDGDPSRPPHERVSVRLDRLVPAVTNPVAHLADLYGWGGASFDAERLLGVLELTLGRLGLPVLFLPGNGTDPPSLQVFALDLEPTTDGAGLRLDMVLPAALDVTFPFDVSPPTWTASVDVAADIRVGATGEIRPPFDITVTPPAGSFAGTVTVGLHAHPAQPFLVLGQAGGSRLEFERLDLDAGVELAVTGGVARGGPVADGEITGGRLVIDAGSGDGFLRTVLGGARLESRFDVGFSFAAGTGLRFHGSGGLQIQLPVHVQLGPIELRALYLVAGLSGATVPVELSAAFGARLGPIQASVDRMGMLVNLGFPPGGGNLGPADVGFAFKPPTGVGLAVNLAVLAGGGFLDIDAARGEYAGTLELRLLDFLTIKAIGVISTRMPDGSAGFSLLIILTAEFPGAGLQLGFGFTLLGVGGLVGLNRTMRLQALVDGVRTGAIESVMFPRDIVANAPRIISDLRAFFPPEEGRFLVGPLAKLGWGTPTLVSVTLGVIIEIPGNIAILGVLKVALPSADAPLLLLQVNFVGAVEFDRQRLFFFASLFNSRVLTITIDGELGLLVAWGGDANFVVSVGGFHPSFTPPPLPFPSPRRIALDILNRPGARISVSGYFAVTSNTAQFGARAELLLGFSDFGISGHIAFDALFQFSPFAFIIEISASVSLRAFGVGLFSVDLRFALSGPTPWRAKGRGSISLLFFEISADFDITWGEDRDTTLPPVDVLPLVAAELDKLEGWETVAPTGGQPLVSLRPLTGTDELVLHPLGTLFVRQRAVPLDLRLDKIGAQRPADVNRLSVDVAGGDLVKRSDPDESFALAQFQDMDDAAKLSRPAFERQHAGVELAAGGAAMASRRVVRRSARYEQIIIDTANRRRLRRFTTFVASLFAHFLDGNAISRSPLSQAQATLRQPFAETIRVTGGGYAVASTRDNAATATFTSHAAARDHLETQLAADPALAGALHVIPTAEVRA